MEKIHKEELDWPAIFYLIGSPLALIFLVPWALKDAGFAWHWFIFAYAYHFLSGLCITCGYHRMYSHKAYEAHPFVRGLFLFLGAAMLQKSALEWCMNHRIHHKEVDTDRDPHSAKKGFFWSHMGWIFYKLKLDYSPETWPPDLAKDKLVVLQHKYYWPLAIFMCFGVPTIYGYFMGSAIAGFTWAGVLRVIVSSHCVFMINSAAHFFGKQTYSDSCTARDNWFLAFFSYGEGFHNFHHRFQFDYRNGIRWFHWDPTKWVINLLSYFNLATRLKTASKKDILNAQLKMKEKALLKKGHNISSLEPLRNHVVAAQEKWQALKKEYAELKRAGQQKGTELMRDIKTKKAEARHEFRLAAKAWSQAFNNLQADPA